MGRGRAKAKQTKVARELKYAHHDLDVERLTKELGGSSSRDDIPPASSHEPESEPAH
ncbi:DUF3073 domain-containing protein [Nonomuraea sp. NPDC050663]|uniref:DUF3073 domain-containing protein n=1 Tax=Nonomuraea soli TaxID=1032476 RepID=A0A7W0CIU7_9ACTN|nr:DUF3073 domain-containing protein [Nonomuraea soli]MBA2891961.1 hypothetical protein [Nonomuraea soli]